MCSEQDSRIHTRARCTLCLGLLPLALPSGPSCSLQGLRAPYLVWSPQGKHHCTWDCVPIFITQGEITLQTIFRVRHPCPCDGILSRSKSCCSWLPLPHSPISLVLEHLNILSPMPLGRDAVTQARMTKAPNS